LNHIIRFSYEALNFSPVSPFLLSSVCYPFQTDTFLLQSPLLAPSMNPAFWVEGWEWFCCHYFPTKSTTLIIQIVMRKLAPLFQFVPYPSLHLHHLVVLFTPFGVCCPVGPVILRDFYLAVLRQLLNRLHLLYEIKSRPYI
jgi:hypothetical protein